MINISICLSDIPKEKIQTAKNGKKYLPLTNDKKRQLDTYGQTHTVYINQSKEEREAKAEKVYIGKGKEFKFNKKKKKEPAKKTSDLGINASDDLPF